jgi:acetylornithine deacetylase/succinyl-diaminopimelate desuccinylase-like protein
MDDQTLSWCKRLIGCRSVTNEGTRAIAELCAREMLAPLGLEARLIPSPGEGADQVNLIATIKGTDPGATPLVLNTHLDTVPPGNPALWTECSGDPFSAPITGDRIYGLGAADTKLDFVAKARALGSVQKPRRDVWLVATFGEEHGLVGAKELAASGILPRGALAFIGEPSRLEVITAHKGLMVFELRVGFVQPVPPVSRLCRWVSFAGRAAHSSTPALGRNAILIALDALAARPDLRVAAIRGGDAVNKVPAQCEVLMAGDAARPMVGGSATASDEFSAASIPSAAISMLAKFTAALAQFAERAGPTEPNYASPTLTSNPGVIHATHDSILLDFELRPPPSLDLGVVRQGVTAIVERLRTEARTLDLELSERRANPGFRGALDGETVELALTALARAGLPLNTGVKAGCTEAGIYAAVELKPVVFGPGPSTGVIHAPNEYNLVAEVDGATQFYRELLRL